MWRTHRGAAYSSAPAVPPSRFRWVRGAAGIRRYESSPGGSRPFCGRCGSAVPGSAGELVFIAPGLLDDDPEMRPQAHIFVASKAPWHEIADSLPRFDAYPSGMGEAVPFERRSEPVAGRVRGSCLCGGVAYEIGGPVAGPIANCHCTRCRKARAAAHASNLFVQLPDFRWLRGEELVVSYKVPEAERFTQAFCRTCGAKVPHVNAARGRVVVPAGPLDDDPGAREELHIFVGSKAPWYEIAAVLPQHEAYPPRPWRTRTVIAADRSPPSATMMSNGRSRDRQRSSKDLVPDAAQRGVTGRINPSCATDTTSFPSCVNRCPVTKPRAPCAAGLSCA